MNRPNLLFIFTDEQRADTLAAYGNHKIDMPNLNRLAESSVVFDQAYCTQPVCTPARSSLLSGLYPHTTGCKGNNIPLASDTRTLPELVSQGNYVTGYHGKWHLGDEIFAQHGFDEWVSIEDNYSDYYSPGRDRSARSSYHHFLLEHDYQPDDNDHFSRGFAAKLPEAVGKPAFLAETAARFIRQYQQQPFILFVNFLEPHMPFFGPRDHQYDPAAVDLPPNFADVPTNDQHLKARLCHAAYFEHGHSGLPLKNEADWRRMIANYWGLNSLVDTHTGTILSTLEDCGLMEDTIIVFTSDHGDMMGSHQLLAKTLMFQEAVRVPLLIKLPGQTEPRHVQQPISQIDLLPTLLDYMGQDIPEHLQGKSRRAEMEGEAHTHDDVFIEWNSSETGILEHYHDRPLPVWLTRLADRTAFEQAIADPLRTVVTPDGWKFTYSFTGQHELYELTADPYETTNLAGKAEHSSRMRMLAGKIRDWQLQSGDSVPMVSVSL